jgi:hypothetical protein
MDIVDGTGRLSHYRREIHTIMECEFGERVMIEYWSIHRGEIEID